MCPRNWSAPTSHDKSCPRTLCQDSRRELINDLTFVEDTGLFKYFGIVALPKSGIVLEFHVPVRMKDKAVQGNGNFFVDCGMNYIYLLISFLAPSNHSLHLFSPFLLPSEIIVGFRFQLVNRLEICHLLASLLTFYLLARCCYISWLLVFYSSCFC